VLLEPIVAGERVCLAVWEHTRDAPVPRQWQPVDRQCVLLFDGTFLHRPELRDRWDLSIFCRIDPATSCARMAVQRRLA
jgi:uridine kinase